jgi:hypothetical protein
VRHRGGAGFLHLGEEAAILFGERCGSCFGVAGTAAKLIEPLLNARPKLFVVIIGETILARSLALTGRLALGVLARCAVIALEVLTRRRLVLFRGLAGILDDPDFRLVVDL